MTFSKEDATHIRIQEIADDCAVAVLHVLENATRLPSVNALIGQYVNNLVDGALHKALDLHSEERQEIGYVPIHQWDEPFPFGKIRKSREEVLAAPENSGARVLRVLIQEVCEVDLEEE